MKKNHVLSPLSPLRHFGPLFYILVIIWLDSKVTASIITPVFGVIGLAYMALSFTPQRMLFWAIIYSIIIAAIFLISPLDYLLNVHQNIDPITAWVRTLSFMITSILAFKYVSKSLIEIWQQLLRIYSDLKIAIFYRLSIFDEIFNSSQKNYNTRICNI